MQQRIQIAGMPWFDEDDYESFRQILPGRHWHATYAAWEAAAEQNLKRLNDQGLRTIKAKVRSADFVEWCRSRGHDVDTKALTAFGAEAAYRHFDRDH